MRCHLLLSALLLAAVACGTDTTNPDQPPPPPNPAVGTYSIHTVDGARFPIVTVSQADTSCLDIDSGGWFTLFADGTYATVLSRVSTVCNGRLVVARGIAWRGVYAMVNDHFVRFERMPPSESFFYATFDPGTYRPGSSGTLPKLTFRDGEHDYVVLAEVP